MLSNLFFPKDNLVETARNRMNNFKKSRPKYIKRSIDEFIEIIRSNIILEASLGESYYIFHMDAHLYEIDSFEVEYGGITKRYQLKGKDKDYIMTEIIKHYSDTSEYEGLKVLPENASCHMIKFDWSSEEYHASF